MLVAVYKGEEVLCVGTPQECAKMLGVKKNTIIYYLSPSYKERIAKRSKSNAIEAFKIDEGEEVFEK